MYGYPNQGYGVMGGSPSYGNAYTPLMVREPRQEQQSGGMPSMPGLDMLQQFTGGGGAAGSQASMQNAVGIDGAMGNGVGGAGGNTFFGQGGLFSGSGSLGSAGPIGAIMAAVAASKAVEANNGNNTFGRILASFNAPSFNQIKADRKLGWTTAAGIPFVNGFIRNDKAATARPEWEGLLGMGG